MTRRKSLLMLVFAWSLLPAATGRASVFELFGAGPRSVGMAGAMAGAARGAEAAFHNPALLGDSRLAGVWAGFTSTVHDLSVQLARPACTGPYLACRAQHIAGFSSRETHLPRDTGGLTLGWHYPLGGVFHNRVVLGAALAMPWKDILRISGPDPQTPQFLMFESLPDRLAFLFAGAWRVTNRWSVGVGAQVLAQLGAEIALDLDPTNHRLDYASTRISLTPQGRLTAGTSFRATDYLTLGLGYRQALSLQYRIPTDIKVGAAIDAVMDLGQETLFTPDAVHAGAAWRVSDRLLLAADLGLALWSQTPDPSPYVWIDVGGQATNALGAGGLFDVGTDTAPLDLHFADTWNPAVAAEWEASRSWVVRGGYTFRPSPAPRAIGFTNYLDNPTHGIGAGFSWRFGQFTSGEKLRLGAVAGDRPPAGEAAAPFSVDVGTQLLVLPRRTVIKRDPNDPVGDLQHGGQVWHVSVAFGGAF
jgi:hypothetical protein